MSYLVLARKYRPQNFDEVTGQEHITGLLKKAIQSVRIGQAFLFSGPRGIGKTSCARILAKSLNCEKGPTLIPCDLCPACQEITKGTSFDVLEIDGASNRGIDEIRALRENVKFAPGYGRFKIYIVDEVHMLTAEAFNALLKTLEEPPDHVKFILATTLPAKVPATIISRCQRFDFKRISLKTIVETLQEISQKEGLRIDQDALYGIAKAADGSMRDALSILDQLSALSDRQIIAGDVFSMLGLVETQLLFDLADAVAQKNCSLALQVLEEITARGKDVKQLTLNLTEHFRNLMILKIGGKTLGRLVDYPVTIKEMLLDQSQRFTLKEILNCMDGLIEAQETARITESLRMPLEIALAKLTYQGEGGMVGQTPGREGAKASANLASTRSSNQPLVSPPVRLPMKNETPASTAIPHKPTAPNLLKTNNDQPNASASQGRGENLAASVSRESTSERPGPTEAQPETVLCNEPEDNPVAVIEQEPGRDVLGEEGHLDVEKIKRGWDALTHAVSQERMSIATCLQDGVPVEFKDGKLIIGFSKNCKFHKEILEGPGNIKFVQDIVSHQLRTPIVIQYEIVDDYQPQEEEPLIKSALETFKGKVVNRWHNE